VSHSDEIYIFPNNKLHRIDENRGRLVQGGYLHERQVYHEHIHDETSLELVTVIEYHMSRHIEHKRHKRSHLDDWEEIEEIMMVFLEIESLLWR
jgi:hypothetical protein